MSLSWRTDIRYHFTQAAADGQAVKAADYALAAGHCASARLGHEEAAAHCERGLQALGLGEWPTRSGAASCCSRSATPGDDDKALELVNGALDTAQRLGLTALADKARRLKQVAVQV